MKSILAIIAALAVGAGAAFAGCGKKVTDAGELKAFDADTKQITVVVGDSEVVRKVTPSTKTTGKDGAEVAVADLVGKKVTVVSEHDKIDTIAES